MIIIKIKVRNCEEPEGKEIWLQANCSQSKLQEIKSLIETFIDNNPFKTESIYFLGLLKMNRIEVIELHPDLEVTK